MGILKCIGLLALTNYAVFSMDWAQWRGPNRDGVLPSSVKIAYYWESGKPKELWRSEKIISSWAGGWGSPAVSKGKVFILVHWKYRVPIEERILTESNLRRLGWLPEKPPAEVLNALEQARLSQLRRRLQGREHRRELEQWINDTLKRHLQGGLMRKFGGVFRERLKLGSRALPYSLIDKLATIRNKRFESQQELNEWFARNGLTQEQQKSVMRFIPTSREEANDVVLCLDAQTGKTIWKKELKGRAYRPALSSTPCVAGKHLYVLASESTLWCLDTETGNEVWKAKTEARASVDLSSSPLVVDGVVVVLGGELMGFDAQTGNVLWTQNRISGRYQSAVLWKKNGKDYVISNSNRGVGCVDLETGELLWTIPGGGWSTPCVSGDYMVIFTNRRDGLCAYKLSTSKPQKLWTVDVRDRGASPIIYDGCVYAIGGRGNARALCVELATGEVKWNEKFPANVEIASPIAVGGKIIHIVNSWLYMIEATPVRFNILARANLGITECTTPAFADSKLFLRLKDAVACYDLASP